MTCDNMLTHQNGGDSVLSQPLLPSKKKNPNLFGAKKTTRIEYGNNNQNRLLNGMLFDVSIYNYKESKKSDDVSTTNAPTTMNTLDILDEALDVLGDDDIDDIDDCSFLSERITPVTVTAKEVKFARHDMIHEIPHLDDLSDEEVEDVWIGRKEMKEIRRHAVQIVKQIDNEEDYDEGIMEELKEEEGSDVLNIRGLDQNTESYMKRRQAAQEFIYETVFRLQPFKKQNEVDVDGIIADLYTKYSSSELVAALERAKLDEWEAREVYCEEFIC